jgi:hypothetical protein
MGFGEAAETFFHDFAGLLMMPLAVLILAGELWLMRKLVVPDPPAMSGHSVAKPKAALGQDA